MKFLVYEMYSQSPKENNEIYILNDANFLAILVDKLPKSKEERIKINEIRKSYKLKFIEITQNQFLNYIKNEKISIKEISFIEDLESEDKEEINDYITNKKYFELFKKLKEDEYYYYISSIKIELEKEELVITLKKNLEVEVEDNSFDQYSIDDIFKILSKENVLSTLINQGDNICS